MYGRKQAKVYAGKEVPFLDLLLALHYPHTLLNQYASLYQSVSSILQVTAEWQPPLYVLHQFSLELYPVESCRPHLASLDSLHVSKVLWQ